MAKDALRSAQPCAYKPNPRVSVQDLQGLIQAAGIKYQIVIQQDQNFSAGLIGQVVHVGGEVVGRSCGNSEARSAVRWLDPGFIFLAAIP